jgi:hypothetical protein
MQRKILISDKINQSWFLEIFINNFI